MNVSVQTFIQFWYGCPPCTNLKEIMIQFLNQLNKITPEMGKIILKTVIDDDDHDVGHPVYYCLK